MPVIFSISSAEVWTPLGAGGRDLALVVALGVVGLDEVGVDGVGWGSRYARWRSLLDQR